MAENKKIQFNSGITVDDGSVKESIRNKFGEVIGEFTFRPTDIDMLERYNDVVDDFEEIIAPLEQVGINPDGSATKLTDEKDIEILKTAKQALFEKVDYIFNGNAAEAFFGQMNPFSIVGGRFYCENVLYALGKYIGNAFDREVKNVNSRMNGHGNRTGKHKNGGKKGSK